MEQGVVFGRDMLGYDVRDGKLFINEGGAETVRLIFHKFVNEDKGTHVIARELREAGIPTSTYMKQWSNTVILKVLRNEKYCGDLIQKKTFTPSYLTHEKKFNRGEEEFVVLHDHHEPIISKELFERAQVELARRSPNDEQKFKHSNRYCFSGKIKCGVCGASFVSRTKKRKDGSVYKAWRCYEAANHGAPHVDTAGNPVGCSCMSLNDEDAKWMLQEVVKGLSIDTRKTVENLTTIISHVLGSTGNEDKTKGLEAKISQISDKKQRLIELYLNKDISREDFQNMSAKCDEEATLLREQMCNSQRQDGLRENQAALMATITETLESLSAGEQWDDTFYRHILDRITVFGENRLDVELALVPAKHRFCKASGDCRHFDTSVPISVRTPVTSP